VVGWACIILELPADRMNMVETCEWLASFVCLSCITSHTSYTVWRIVFICVTWIIHICHITHSSHKFLLIDMLRCARKNWMSSWLTDFPQIPTYRHLPQISTHRHVCQDMWMTCLIRMRVTYNVAHELQSVTYRTHMGCLWLVGSFKIYVSFAEYSLFHRALLQKRPIF